MNAIRAFFSGAHAISDATRVNLKFSYTMQIAISLLIYIILRKSISSRIARTYAALLAGSITLLITAYLFQ